MSKDIKKGILLILLGILLLICISSNSFAQTPTTVGQVLEFAWDQSTEDLGGISGWVLYESNVSGSGYTPAVEIPYASGAGPTFTSENTLTFFGTKGSTVTKYFVLTAKSKDIAYGESTYSNEVSVGVVIPYGKPTSPFTFKVNIKTQ